MISELNLQIKNNLCNYNLEIKTLETEIDKLQVQLSTNNIKYKDMCHQLRKSNTPIVSLSRSKKMRT